MTRPLRPLFVALIVAVPLTVAFAQLGGSRAGIEDQSGQGPLPPLARDIAMSFITIDGRAELRVEPTEIRMVLAVTSEGETAAECRRKIAEQVKGLREAWRAMDIEDDRVAEDFIAILPRYQWTIQKRGDAEVGVEERSGYHMQTNLHVPLDGEQDAQTALNAAFEHGVTDIIAFDYHNDGLNELKADARVRALDAANDKADALLRELFGDQRPKVINVQEHTVVHRPQSQYQSFTNTVDQSITTAPRQGMPLIGAIRPRNTYYRGLQSGADIEPQRLALRPEISVVSTVRLYYESPTAKNNKPNAAKRAKREP